MTPEEKRLKGYTAAMKDYYRYKNLNEIKKTLKLFEEIEEYEMCQGIKKAVDEIESQENG